MFPNVIIHWKSFHLRSSLARQPFHCTAAPSIPHKQQISGAGNQIEIQKKWDLFYNSVCLLFNLWGFEWNSIHCQMIVRSRNTNSLNYASILIQQQARPHQRGERLTGTFSIFVFFKPAFSLKAPSEMDGNRGDWSRAINYTAMWFHVIIKCMLSMWQWLCFTCLRKFKKCILLKAQKV